MTSAPQSGPGPVGEEAARLLDAVQGWARTTFGDGPSAHVSTDSAVCQWCPLCQLVAVLRGDRPEATEKIVAAGSALLGALRSLLDSPSTQPRDAGSPEESRVEPIDLDS